MMLTLTEVLKGSVICKEPRKETDMFVTKSRYMTCSKHHNPDMILMANLLRRSPDWAAYPWVLLKESVWDCSWSCCNINRV